MKHSRSRRWARSRWSLLLLALVVLVVLSVLLSRSNLFADPGPSAQALVEDGWPMLDFTQEIGGLNRPAHITHAGDNSGRLFVIEQEGRIRIIKDGQLQEEPFLDVTDRVTCCGERGLLSVVFDNTSCFGPDYIYINYTRTADDNGEGEGGTDDNGEGNTVVARYTVSSNNPDRVDVDSYKEILEIAQPYINHNGGQMAFGPDGYLYIGMGDGGDAGDPHNYAQDPSSLLGKMLRIDVRNQETFAIPPSNPFVDDPAYRDEIWALGLRNPWRFSFDRDTGDLYIADVGQNAYEEVNFQPASSNGGENYGWSCKEGTHDYPVTRVDNCDSLDLVPPVAEYDHSQGVSVTGGFVYRGTEFARMQGVYFYGDFGSGKIWGLRHNGERWENVELADTNYSISSFGEDEEGNLYLADYSGRIVKLVDAAAPLPAQEGAVPSPAAVAQVSQLTEPDAFLPLICR
jgi:glucose/arabinose dehydrogenase